MIWPLVELIEAAARGGATETAAGACERLAVMTDASGTDWALGLQARSRALLSQGEQAERRHRVETSGELTAQEAQIARRARDGLSNPEIGIRLFISAHTVQYHLREVFAKLGITSRSQLDRVLPGVPGSADRIR